MYEIRINALSKTFPPEFPRLKRLFGRKIEPDVTALKDINLVIKPGETFGLIGNNGAGKTTLTKSIATLIMPTSGSISVGEYDTVKDDVKVRSVVGFANAEERSFYWRLTSTQNLMFFARLYGMTDKSARERIFHLFNLLKFTDMADRKFAELSTGNKQKLAVARALLSDPVVLLLDEPTRSLDPIAAGQMRNLISLLKEKTILLTSHNLSEIETLCERIAVISKGEIKEVGTAKELRSQYSELQEVTIEFKSAVLLNFETLGELPENAVLDQSENEYSLKFSRRPDDDLLGKIVSQLNEKGAIISEIKTERASLLDILEKYQ